jgi:hypothetical protein
MSAKSSTCVLWNIKVIDLLKVYIETLNGIQCNIGPLSITSGNLRRGFDLLLFEEFG